MDSTTVCGGEIASHFEVFLHLHPPTPAPWPADHPLVKRLTSFVKNLIDTEKPD